MKQKITLLCMGLLACSSLYAQLGEFRFKTADGDSILITAIAPKPDGGLYALGFNNPIFQVVFGDQARSEALLLDISSENTVNWAKRYDLGISRYAASSIAATQDGGMVAGGTRRVGFGQDTAYLQPVGIVQKYDAEGDVEWTSATGVGFASTDGYTAIEASDGAYFLLGWRFTGLLREALNLSKFDNNGNLLWSRVYNELGAQQEQILAGTHLQELPDGGFLITGLYNDHSFVIRLDGQGLPVWSNTYSYGNFSTFSTKTLPLGDGTFAIAHQANHNIEDSTNQVVVMRMNGDGTLLWSRRIALAQPLADPGPDDSMPSARIAGFERTNDGHLLIAANSDFSGSGNLRPALIKIAYDGSWVWGKVLVEAGDTPNYYYDYGEGTVKHLAVTTNDHYALIYHKADEPTSFRLVKVDADGQGACTDDVPDSILAPVNLVVEPFGLNLSEGGEQIAVPQSTTEQSFLVERVINYKDLDLLNDTLLCGDSLTLAPDLADDASFLWQDGSTSPTLTVTEGGDYALTVTVDGCTAADTASVFTTEAGVDLGEDRSACAGDTLSLAPTVILPGDYQWNNGASTPELAITQSGTYSLALNTACGVLADTVEARFFTPPSLNPAFQLPNCNENNGQVSIDPMGGDTVASIQWFGTDGTLLAQDVTQLENLGAGDYEVVVTLGEGCMVTANFNLTALPPPTATPIISPPNCPGQANGFIELANLSGTAPFAFQWSLDGQPLPGTDARIAGLAPGLYAYTLTDADGCAQAEDSLLLPEAMPVSFELNAAGPACPGESTGAISLSNTGSGTGPYTFQLNGGAAQSEGAFAGLTAGTYRILIEDERGCDTVLTAELLEAETPSFALQASANPVSFGETVQLQAIDLSGAGLPGDWQWSADPPLPLSCTACAQTEATATQTTDLRFELTLADGCTFAQSLRLEVDQDRRIYIPNAFSPNGDGRNDRFELYPGPGVAQLRHFRVFDRWGSLVFEAEGEQPGWDGQVRGRPAAPGVYTYTVLVEWIDGRLDNYGGTVQLAR